MSRAERTSARASSIELESSSPDGLHHHVAECGGFDGTGHDGSCTSVGGELAKHAVLHSTPHHVDRLEGVSDDLFQIAERQAIAQDQAFKCTAHDVTFGLRDWVPGVTAVLGDGGRHIAGSDKGLGVGVDNGHHRRCLFGHGDQSIPAPIVSFAFPLFAALLQDPQPSDVLQ